MQMGIEEKWKKYNLTLTSAAPLAFFRIAFGCLMTISLIRFWSKGWIEKLYLEPSFHFTYWGFDFVQVPGLWTYFLFAIGIASSVGIILGYRYRWMMGIFFLSFSYIELMDVTTYLNHYYFISSLSFLLFFLPLSNYFSLDTYLGNKAVNREVPKWTIDAIKLLLAIVYIYAGLAKINSDWLLEAKPLSIWLTSKSHLPIIGSFLDEPIVHYLFSWSGMLYDLGIVFLLISPRWRKLGFLSVLLFHGMTALLFNIGMFPYVMIVATMIFFDASYHQKMIDYVRRYILRSVAKKETKDSERQRALIPQFYKSIVILFLAFHLLFPWRYLMYPDHLFWHEQGYRFSWRVMLMEKTGYTVFRIKGKDSSNWFSVQNEDFLTTLQEKQMATQPDLILQYAHHLKKHFDAQEHSNVEVYVDSYVSVNGSPSKRFIDPSTNLASESESWKTKKWILPYE